MKKTLNHDIIKTITELGNGATIAAIEQKLPYERHTLSKYLSLMESQGILSHIPIGKAKVWSINKAPLKSVLSAQPAQQSFTEKILSNIITNIPLGLIVIDQLYNIQYMSHQMTKVYGNVQGNPFYRSILGLENPMKVKKIMALIDGKEASVEEATLDLKQRNLKIHGSRLQNPDGSYCFVLLVEDITQAKRMEEEIYTQKSLLESERQALNKSAIVAETDLAGRITYVNDKFVEISGYSPDELLGKTHKIVNSEYHPRSFFQNMWTMIAKGKIWRGEIRNKRKDGTYYWVDTTISPIFGRNGKPVKYLSIRFDITKKKELEASKGKHGKVPG